MSVIWDRQAPRHAPSGSETLTDKQRKELLTNLLQSNSMALPGTSLGNGSFLIGGDMNTGPYVLGSILDTCRNENVLFTETTIVAPMWAKHGDVCIRAGFEGSDLTTRATAATEHGTGK